MNTCLHFSSFSNCTKDLHYTNHDQVVKQNWWNLLKFANWCKQMENAEGKKRDQRLNVHKDIQQKCECVCEGVSKRPCTAQWLGCRPSHLTFKDQFNTRPIILIDRPLVIIVVLRLNHANFEEKWITAACPWPVQDTRTLWKHSWHPTLVGWT